MPKHTPVRFIDNSRRAVQQVVVGNVSVQSGSTSGFVTVGGTASAGKPALLDSSGQWDESMIPFYYEPLTNGLEASPELVFAGGDVVMVKVLL